MRINYSKSCYFRHYALGWPEKNGAPMKKILFLSLLMTSQASFANILENTDPTLIVRAIKDSLRTNDLNCYESVKKFTVLASSLRLDNLNEYEVQINAGTQPVIKFYQNKDNYETTVLVTTNADYTVVTDINTEQYIVSKTTVERNTGTIINPNYEVITDVTKTLSEKLDCK